MKLGHISGLRIFVIWGNVRGGFSTKVSGGRKEGFHFTVELRCGWEMFSANVGGDSLSGPEAPSGQGRGKRLDGGGDFLSPSSLHPLSVVML